MSYIFFVCLFCLVARGFYRAGFINGEHSRDNQWGDTVRTIREEHAKILADVPAGTKQPDNSCTNEACWCRSSYHQDRVRSATPIVACNVCGELGCPDHGL